MNVLWLPQQITRNQRLKMTEMCSVTGQEAGSLRPRWRLGKRTCPVPLSWLLVVATDPWRSWLADPTPSSLPVSSHHLFWVSVCVLSSSCKDRSLWIWDPASLDGGVIKTHNKLHLQSPCFQTRSCSEVPGGRDWGRHALQPNSGGETGKRPRREQQGRWRGAQQARELSPGPPGAPGTQMVSRN